jgi:hypothetical protein
MITSTILGILSSTVAEIVTALNKKLNGTVLAGDAAFLIALFVSLVGAVAKTMIAPGFTWSMLTDWATIGTTFGGIFAVSQVYFVFIVKKLNLDVPATPANSQTTI